MLFFEVCFFLCFVKLSSGNGILHTLPPMIFNPYTIFSPPYIFFYRTGCDDKNTD